MSATLSWLVLLVIFGGLAAFAAFAIRSVVRHSRDLERFGSAKGVDFQARVIWTYGEVPATATAQTSLVQSGLRVHGLEASPPAVGLELAASGFAFRDSHAVRLELDEAERIAHALEAAAAGYPGSAPGGGFGFYALAGYGPSMIESVFARVEKRVGALHRTLSIVRVTTPPKFVGLTFKKSRTGGFRVMGASLPPEGARVLAALLRQAADAARAGYAVPR